MTQEQVVAVEAFVLVGLAAVVIATGTPLTRHYRWLRTHPRLKHAAAAVTGVVAFHLAEPDERPLP